MANSPGNETNYEEEEDEDYFEIVDSDSEDFDSDDSEEDPTYDDHLDKAQSTFSKLSIKKNKSNSRANAETELDDGEVSDMEEMSVPELDIKDVKNLEQVQKIIDAGQVEKLKVEQCKVYLRNHGLRLTGKKDILIQRIKEHNEILKGGGERKYPPSSFVLNCKGDACMGDIVMFEQTVYDGYNIVSRSASGAPSGKRIVAGRIVKESYGAAKQQHTFTVEVLWSKGHKALPPLHPLLIKGRNLYRLNTMRQRWEDEAERLRVLNEKHSRGSIARSNRETRIQKKMVKKMLKGMRVLPKEGENSSQCKIIRHQTADVNGSKVEQQHPVSWQTQQLKSCQEPIPKVHVEFKENLHPGLPRAQPFQHSKPAQSTSCGYLKNSFNGNTEISVKSQLKSQDPRQQLCSKYEENSFPPISSCHSFQQKGSTISSFHSNPEQMSYLSEYENPVSLAQRNLGPQYGRYHPKERLMSSINYNHSRGSLQRPSHVQQQLCRYYPQGRCHYGNRCKFLHELNRNHC